MNGKGRDSTQAMGMWYGFLGVVSFSLTLPATRAAVIAFDPTVVTLARGLIAAALAAVALWVTRQRLPGRSHWGGLVVTASCVVLGFPLLMAWAMRYLPASHGAVVLGLLPLATAIGGAVRGGERPSAAFWLWAVAGSGAVVAYALREGVGQFQAADLVLLAAVAAAGLGYAEGGRLARELGGWQVISWAVVLAGPFLVVPLVLAVRAYGLAGPPSAWLGLGYVGVVSQFLGFFLWYRGMAVGGVARVSQLQLLQPFLTMLASWLLLGESISAAALGAALVVVVTVALGRKAPVERVSMSD